MSVLVTGGAGYIGSHTVLSLLEAGFKVVVVDNFVNSSDASLERVKKLTGKDFEFFKGDIRDVSFLKKVFESNRDIKSVIHFAGLKSVGESVKHPLEYYDVNLSGTLKLLDVMSKYHVNEFIFSSSATVYGRPSVIPLTEDCKTGGTTNPYGTSKYFVEKALVDICNANENLKVKILRYFNPVGAHNSGMIGESPKGIPNNILPYITQVAVGKLSVLKVFGNDYPTPDGTGVRDYIHVMDLAEGHIAALNHDKNNKNLYVFNLGTGCGYSVLEIINNFEKIAGVKIPYEISARREGDIAECWSDPTLANEVLNWRATRGINEMLEDAWRWQKQNPNGYCG